MFSLSVFSKNSNISTAYSAQD